MKWLYHILLIPCLLGQSPDVAAGDPVFKYLDNGEFDKLDQYLQHHDINATYGDSNITVLVYSILHNENKVTRYLIEKGADVNLFVNGKSPLMFAAGIGDNRKVSSLIKNRAEINAVDSAHNTCLIYAVRSGNLKTVKYLVRHGAALNHQNIDRGTAYDESVTHGHSEIAKWLRDAYLRNLPDFHDGPYISWKGKRRVKAFYMVHDSARRQTTKSSAIFKAESNPFLLKGFSRDSLEYLVSKERKIPADHYQEVRQILVLGDMHGGYDSLLVFLRNNGIIDHGLNWTWKEGHLVFLGDIFDRGDKVTEILWLIYRLEAQAAQAGGAVHLILGNHEIMVLGHQESYVSDKYLVMAEKLNLTYANLFGKRTILGQWLRTKNTILKINDLLFVHAGLSIDFLESGFSQQEINDHVRYFLNHPQREYRGTVHRNAVLGKQGPFWYRGYLEDNHEYKHMPEKELDRILAAFQASRVFIGHTNVEQITPLYQSKVFAMDVPFYSNGVEMQGMAIKDEVFYLVNSSGSWIEFR
jgi:hypothetical protein